MRLPQVQIALKPRSGLDLFPVVPDHVNSQLVTSCHLFFFFFFCCGGGGEREGGGVLIIFLLGS